MYEFAVDMLRAGKLKNIEGLFPLEVFSQQWSDANEVDPQMWELKRIWL